MTSPPSCRVHFNRTSVSLCFFFFFLFDDETSRSIVRHWTHVVRIFPRWCNWLTFQVHVSFTGEGSPNDGRARHFASGFYRSVGVYVYVCVYMSSLRGYLYAARSRYANVNGNSFRRAFQSADKLMLARHHKRSADFRAGRNLPLSVLRLRFIEALTRLTFNFTSHSLAVLNSSRSMQLDSRASCCLTDQCFSRCSLLLSMKCKFY